MASPPSPREEPSSPLPAPYEDPWRRLASDLAAVIASAGLKARELWRLNGEGALAAPAFWPLAQRALFWPLVLALGLLLAVGLALRLPAWWGVIPADSPAVRPGSVAPESAAALAGASSPSPSPPLLQSDQPARLDGPEVQPNAPNAGMPNRIDAGGSSVFPSTPSPGEVSQPAPSGTASLPDSLPDLLSESQGDAAVPGTPPSLSPAPPSLLAELLGSEPPVWVLALEPRPAEGLLRLRLEAGFIALPLAERQALAERWQVRCRELGYERLELVGPSGRLLARPARVGSGMILLDAASFPP